MTYFNSRELAAATLFASLWGVLNGVFAPLVFRLFGFPILCDMIGFATLSLAYWWVKRSGAVTVVGLIATMISFIINPAGIQFLGFTVASLAFDLTTSLIGHERLFRNTATATASLLSISIVSAALAGFTIGNFFMNTQTLARWGGAFGWAGLHALGGIAGGLIGIISIAGLSSRQIRSFESENWKVRMS